MIKKLAALGVIAALSFAPVIAFADDAPPMDAKPMADTAKPMKMKMKMKMKHTMKHKMMMKHSMKKKMMMKPTPTPTPMETPKS